MLIQHDSNNFIWTTISTGNTIEARNGFTVVNNVPDMQLDLLDDTGRIPMYMYINGSIIAVPSYYSYTVDNTIWRRYIKHIREELSDGNYEVVDHVDTKADLLAIENPTNNTLMYVSESNRLYVYVAADSKWKLTYAELERNDTISWYCAVDTYNDLYEYDAADGDVALIARDNVIYRYDASKSMWIAVLQIGGATMRGCRISCCEEETGIITVGSGILSLHDVPLFNNLPITLTWDDVKDGATQKADTWYYVYAEQCPEAKTSFKAYISEEQPSAKNFYPTKDAHVKNDHPTTNYGTETTMYIEDAIIVGPPEVIEVRIGYIGFDLSEVETSDFKHANMYFTTHDIVDTELIGLYEVDNAWGETTITYNNAPALGNLITTFSIGSAGDFIVNIHDYIKAKIDANEKVFSLALKYMEPADYENDCFIYTRNSTIPPYIQITSKELASAKYSSIRNSRLIGTFKTDGNGDIVPFVIVNNTVIYNHGYNYIVMGANSTVKTGLNIQSMVPSTSKVGIFYYEMGGQNGLKYIGTNKAWLLNGVRISGQIAIPSGKGLIYYKVADENDYISIGVHGYIEEL